jgi:hypothetical protein
MNTDQKEVMRILSDAAPGAWLTLAQIGGGRDRAYVLLDLRLLKLGGLTERGEDGWRLTAAGRNHVETRMAL